MMDERVGVFGWSLAGAAFLGLLGIVFGALSGGISRSSGHAAGGLLGSIVLASIQRVRDRPLGPFWQGALVGGTDGGCFLGFLGAVAGAVIGYSTQLPWQVVISLGVGAVLLALGGVVFGVLGYALTWLYPRAGWGSPPAQRRPCPNRKATPAPPDTDSDAGHYQADPDEYP
jgi:hypothetical protein